MIKGKSLDLHLTRFCSIKSGFLRSKDNLLRFEGGADFGCGQGTCMGAFGIGGPFACARVCTGAVTTCTEVFGTCIGGTAIFATAAGGIGKLVLEELALRIGSPATKGHWI